MIDYNNNNGNYNSNGENNQNSGSGQSNGGYSYSGDHQQNFDSNTNPYSAPPKYSNEISYYPQKPHKKSGAKTALKALVAVAATIAVSVSSIAGYIAVTDKIQSLKEYSDKNSENISVNSQTDNDDGNNSVQTNAEVPTLVQLAAADDAMYLPDIVDKVSPSVVGVSCSVETASMFGTVMGTQTGTGIIISEDGYIITNAHVVEGAKSISVFTNETEELEATLVGADSQSDLAVLKVNKTGLTAAELGKSGTLRVGELAITIGNPLGFELAGTTTCGIISGLNRTITIGQYDMTLIQTDASINNGNSGGPLINCYGQVVGITSAKVSSTYGEGLGFAIPIDTAIPIIQDLIEHGYVTGRPMIGISGEDITDLMSSYYNLPKGVYVRFVEPESGAEAAGIKPGDIVIGLDGKTITSMDELNSVKANHKAGDTVTLTIYRDGENSDVSVVLGEDVSGD